MLGYKTNLSIFKKSELIQILFSNNKRMKIVIIKRRSFGKFTIIWILKNKVLIAKGSKKKSQQKL